MDGDVEIESLITKVEKNPMFLYKTPGMPEGGSCRHHAKRGVVGSIREFFLRRYGDAYYG